MSDIPIKIVSTTGIVLGAMNFPTIPSIGAIIKVLDKDKITIVEVEKQEFLTKTIGIASIKLVVKELCEVVNNNSEAEVKAGDFIETKQYNEKYFGQVVQLPEYKYLVCIGYKYKEPAPQIMFIKSLVKEDTVVISRDRYYELLLMHTTEVRKLTNSNQRGMIVKPLAFSGTIHDLCPITSTPISKAKCIQCACNESLEEEAHRLKFRVYCSGGK